jgi:phage-related protein
MSFQAYLDAIEKKTGKTPRQLLELARARGYDSSTKQAKSLTG